MIPEQKILARGYSTPEEALAPLRSALPWMKRVEGDLVVPISKFVFQHGEGRGRIRYRVSVAAEKKEAGFDVVLRVERLSAFEVLGLLFGAAVFSAVVGFSQPEALWFVIPFVMLISAVRFVYIWSQVGAASEAFSLPYEEPNQAPEPTAPSGRGSS